MPEGLNDPTELRERYQFSEPELDILHDLVRRVQTDGWAGRPLLHGTLPAMVRVQSLPTAAEGWAGVTVYVSGTPDVAYICLRGAGGSWGWVDFTVEGGMADHSARHEENGADELLVENLGTAGASGTAPVSDGAGGLDMVDVATAAELATHEGAADPHGGYVLNAELTSHEGDATAHDLRPGLGYEYVSGTRVQWRVGEDDANPGAVVLYGGPTGINNGAEARFHLSADHDSSFQYFLFQVFQDDLLVSRNSPTTTLFKIDGGTGRLTGDGIVPTGVICMWHGTLANIPSGWVLCDGTNGTPDLRDKFVRGAPASTNPGSTGGAASHQHATGGAHTHDNHVPGSSLTFTGGGVQPLLTPTTHSSDGGHQHDSVSNLPPYYTVAFIMKS